jgi:hypothetical protein
MKKIVFSSIIVLTLVMLVNPTNGFETYDYMTGFSGWTYHLGELEYGVLGSGFLNTSDFSMRYLYTDTTGKMLAIAELHFSRINSYEICFDAWGRNYKERGFRYLIEVCINY